MLQQSTSSRMTPNPQQKRCGTQPQAPFLTNSDDNYRLPRLAERLDKRGIEQEILEQTDPVPASLGRTPSGTPSRVGASPPTEFTTNHPPHRGNSLPRCHVGEHRTTKSTAMKPHNRPPQTSPPHADRLLHRRNKNKPDEQIPYPTNLTHGGG